jgi:hypothetical protein
LRAAFVVTIGFLLLALRTVLSIISNGEKFTIEAAGSEFVALSILCSPQQNQFRSDPA